MFRFLAPALLLLAPFGAPAVAQFQPRLPLSPGVMPASPWGPGMPMQPRFIPPPSGFGYGGFGGSGGFPIYGGYGLSPGYLGYGGFGGFPFPVPVPVPVPVYDDEDAPRPAPNKRIALANEFPAVLTVQLPAEGEVWLNGVESAGKSAEQVLVSRSLKPGERFTFDVRARWSRGGKKYEAERSVTLGAGESSRLLIFTGGEVRD